MSLVPTVRHHTFHNFLAISDHMADIAQTLLAQPEVPVICSIGDDPIIALLDDPVEVAPVIVAISGTITDLRIDEDGSCVFGKRVCRVVDVEVSWNRVIGSVEA